MSRRTKGLYVLITVLTIGAAIATFFSLDQALTKSNVEVKASIDKSVQTKVDSDAMGAPHLVDKATGSELTVRNQGDSFEVTSKFDRTTGRQLQCIRIHDVAKMVHDVESGTPGSVVIKDELGIQKDIMTITGDFHDEGQFNI